MRKKPIDMVVYILYLPLYLFYGILYAACVVVCFFLRFANIEPSFKNEVRNIFRGDNIKKQFIYAFFRFLNVCLMVYFFYRIGTQSYKGFSWIKELWTVFVMCVAGVALLHFIKKLLYKRMDIVPFYVTNRKEMDGVRFENYCASLLASNGYKNIELTKASGDQGVDIVADYKKEKYAIQCKYYATPIGNKAIQEVHAGKSYYGCDRAMVMTNQSFTKGATELAEKVEVKLWGSIPVISYGRDVMIFWYAVDIILGIMVALKLGKNIDNATGIVMVFILAVYCGLFAYESYGRLKKKDLKYYLKNHTSLTEEEFSDYKRLIEDWVKTNTHYEETIKDTYSIDEFVIAMDKLTEMYDMLDEHEKTGVLEDELEDKMDEFYQKKHEYEIAFVDRTYPRDDEGYLAISRGDYEKMRKFTPEAKEYIVESVDTRIKE